MLQHAAELGANAVVAARYDATEVMQGVTEVLGMARRCSSSLRSNLILACDRNRQTAVRSLK